MIESFARALKGLGAIFFKAFSSTLAYILFFTYSLREKQYEGHLDHRLWM
jgi:hypothetical protein